jgi:hypothetical protein
MRSPESYFEGFVLLVTVGPLGGRLLAGWQRRLSLTWTWSLCLLPLVAIARPVSLLLALTLAWMSVRAARLGKRWHSDDLVAGRDLAQAAESRLGIRDAIQRTVLNRRVKREGWVCDGSLIIGRDSRRLPVCIPLERGSGSHTLIVGATGSGKTVSEAWIAARMIEAGHGAIAIDPKGDRMLRTELRRAALAANRPFLEWTPAGPCSYNPYAGDGDGEIVDKALAGEVFTEPHYLRQAQRYLGHAVRAMRAAGVAVTVPSLVEHLQPDRLELTARSLDASEGEPIGDYVISLTERQRRELAGVRDRLSILAESDVRRWLDPAQAPTIDLRDAVRSRAVVYFALDADRRPLLAQMVAVALVSDLVTLAAHLQTEPTPTVVLIDEFSALAARQVSRLFGRARSAGLSVLLATQELADLQAADASLRDQILGNVQAVIAHRQNVPGSAETIAKLASMRPVWLTSQYTDHVLGHYGPADRGNRRRDYDYRIHPSSVQQLATGQALVITPGGAQPPTVATMLHP